MKLMNHGQDRHNLTSTIKATKSLFFICLFLSFPTQADKLDTLYATLEGKLITPSALKDAAAMGEERASVCKFCHGKDGNSRRDYIPNLAEQNSKYLLNQFQLFATKQRNNRIMSELAKNLTDDDRINIALYYSTQKVKAEPQLSDELAAKGQKIFKTKCSACHGEDGHGSELLPRIASQPTEYLKRTLDNYRNKPDFRPSSPMQAIVSIINESEQAIVTSYISTME